MSNVRTARRVGQLAPGKLFTLLKEASGSGALDLALGIPAVPGTPAELIEFGCQVLRSGHNQYEVPDGNPRLRRQIAATLPVATDPATELTITVGATEGLAAAVLATVEPGDEVIVFEPFYENFISAVSLAGGVVRLVRLHAPDWRYDPAELRAAFGPRTRAIMLSTPNNPTGRVLSQTELRDIGELCQRWNVLAIADEIYAGFVFDGHRHISIMEVPELTDRSLVVGSLSKTHAVSGWRLGYLRASAPLSRAVREVHTALCGGTASPLQEAAARAVEAGMELSRVTEGLGPQRDRLRGILADAGIVSYRPEGSCYLLAEVPPEVVDSEAMAYQLLRQVGVLVAPGQFFCSADAGPDARFVRLAFNRTQAFLDEVQTRLRCYVSAIAAAR